MREVVFCSDKGGAFSSCGISPLLFAHTSCVDDTILLLLRYAVYTYILSVDTLFVFFFFFVCVCMCFVHSFLSSLYPTFVLFFFFLDISAFLSSHFMVHSWPLVYR